MANPKLKEFFEKAASKNSMTPDLGHITRHYDALPVFVYGTQKKNFSEHYQMERAVRVGDARTSRSTHVMYVHKVGEWKEPLVFHMPANPASGCILGELFIVPVSEFPDLDNLMSNGLWVRRSMEHVRYKTYYDDGRVEPCITEAYIYLADIDQWKSKQENGQLVRHTKFTGDIGPYYTFMGTDDLPNRQLIKAAKDATAKAIGKGTEMNSVRVLM